MFEYNGVNYELRYNIKRIEMIESATRKSVVSIMKKGALSINELKIMFAYGVCKEGTYAFELPKKALTMAEEMLGKTGSYIEMSDMVAEAIERDCPFFFPAG